MSKGNSSCHIPNDKYRENYDKIFKKTPIIDAINEGDEELRKKLNKANWDKLFKMLKENPPTLEVK